jgi:Flp pilus assembly protein TadG
MPSPSGAAGVAFWLLALLLIAAVVAWRVLA